MRNGKEWRWRPLVFFFFVSRAPSSDFVAVEFGEFAQHRQRVDEPLAQDRLAAVARDVAQSVRAALALAVDVRHQVAAVGAVGRQHDLGVVLEEIDLSAHTRDTVSGLHGLRLDRRTRRWCVVETPPARWRRQGESWPGSAVTCSVQLSSCMMMTLGVRTQRFMWMKAGGERRDAACD